MGNRLFSPNTNTNSDPRYTLLVSQALIERQTLRLDAYKAEIDNQTPVESRLWEKDGHTFYAYPLAASVLGVPFVLPLYLAGYDMTILADEEAAQNLLSALVVALIFLILYQIVHIYLPFTASLAIAATAVLGSTLMSTLGTALWGHDLAVLFICLSLWLLVRLEKERPLPFTPYALGTCLFLAYFSRPTATVFIAVTLVYLFISHRRIFWPAALTALFWLIGFSLVCQNVFGLWLPPYYLPRHLGGLLAYGDDTVTPLPIAIYGLLFSPSRCLFVFSPVFLLAAAGTVWYWRRLRQHGLVWLCLIWSVGQVALIALFSNWWGGFSFGPRLLTDMVPALVLLGVFVAQAWFEDSSRRRPPTILWLFLGGAVFSVAVHSGIALHSRDVALSYGHSLPPHVDKAPFLLMDWRYPQFLTTPDAACARNKTYFETLLAKNVISVLPHSTGKKIPTQAAGFAPNLPDWPWWQSAPLEKPDGSPASIPAINGPTFLPVIMNPANQGSILPAVFIGWILPAGDGVWSACRTADILIGPVAAVGPESQLTLSMTARGHQDQMVTIRVNGTIVGRQAFSEAETEVQVSFPAAPLLADQPNVISFDLPQAFAQPELGEPLLLGIFLEELIIDE